MTGSASQFYDRSPRRPELDDPEYRRARADHPAQLAATGGVDPNAERVPHELEVRAARGAVDYTRPIRQAREGELPRWAEKPGAVLGTWGEPTPEERIALAEAGRDRDRAARRERGLPPLPDRAPPMSYRPNVGHLTPVIEDIRRRLLAGDPEPRPWWRWRRAEPTEAPLAPPPGFDWLPVAEVVEICQLAFEHCLERRGADRDAFVTPARATSRSMAHVFRLSIVAQYPDLDLSRAVAWMAPYVPPPYGSRALQLAPFAELIVADLARWQIDGEGRTWLFGAEWPAEVSAPPAEAPPLTDRMVEEMYQTARQIEADWRARDIPRRHWPAYFVERSTDAKVTGMMPAHPERYVAWNSATEEAWDFRARLRSELEATRA